MKHTYTEQQLRQAIIQSTSIRQALQKLGISSKGGSYLVIHKAVKKWNIDTSHFTGQAHSKGKKLSPRRAIEDYLSNNFPINSNRLRKRLIQEKILLPVCSGCNNDSWLNNPIPLELDHVNGDNNDNSLSNLRLLCPNCHALTPTYRGKNKGSYQV